MRAQAMGAGKGMVLILNAQLASLFGTNKNVGTKCVPDPLDLVHRSCVRAQISGLVWFADPPAWVSRSALTRAVCRYPAKIETLLSRFFSWTEANVFSVVSFDCLHRISFLQTCLLFLVTNTLVLFGLWVWASCQSGEVTIFEHVLWVRRTQKIKGKRRASMIESVHGTWLSISFISTVNSIFRHVF